MTSVFISLLLVFDLFSQVQSVRCIPEKIQVSEFEVLCTCENTSTNSTKEQFSLQNDIFETFPINLIQSTSSIHLSGCHGIDIDLSLAKDYFNGSYGVGTCNFILKDSHVNNLLIPEDVWFNSFSVNNVTFNTIWPVSKTEPANDLIFFYSTLGLSALLGLILIVALILLIIKLRCSKWLNSKRRHGQKVSRTQSWRFESNHFVNVPPRIGKPKVSGNGNRSIFVSPPIVPSSGVSASEVIPLNKVNASKPCGRNMDLDVLDNGSRFSDDGNSVDSFEDHLFTSRPTLPIDQVKKYNEKNNKN